MFYLRMMLLWLGVYAFPSILRCHEDTQWQRPFLRVLAVFFFTYESAVCIFVLRIKSIRSLMTFFVYFMDMGFFFMYCCILHLWTCIRGLCISISAYSAIHFAWTCVFLPCMSIYTLPYIISIWTHVSILYVSMYVFFFHAYKPNMHNSHVYMVWRTYSHSVCLYSHVLPREESLGMWISLRFILSVRISTHGNICVISYILRPRSTLRTLSAFIKYVFSVTIHSSRLHMTCQYESAYVQCFHTVMPWNLSLIHSRRPCWM